MQIHNFLRTHNCFVLFLFFYLIITTNSNKCNYCFANSQDTAEDSGPSVKNILLIIVDDLRNDIGPYLDKTHPMYGSTFTPNIDSLAQRGVTFQRAYVQLTSCNPSRNSFLTGLRPIDLQLYNKDDLVKTTSYKNGKVVTMTRFFRNNGYSVYGVGKIYHQEMPSEFDKYVKLDNQNELCKNVFWCIEPDNQLVDSWVAGQSNDILAAHRRSKSNPFFLIAGFHRPHYMLSFPQWALDDIPKTKINLQLGDSNSDWVKYGASQRANKNSNGIPNIANMQPSRAHGAPMTVNEVTSHKTYYLSAIHWVDKTIGDLLNSVKANGFWNNTAIAMIGDHGLSVGEHSAIGKSTLFEHVSRAPFILSVPWLPKSHGKSNGGVVEFLDIYPTLASAAGLNFVFGSDRMKVVGRDLMPLVKVLGTSKVITSGLPEVELSIKSYAVTEDGRCGSNSGGYKACETVNMGPSTVNVLGITIRTKRWRYTEWRKTTLNPKMSPIWTTNGLYDRELYDHLNDNGKISIDAAKYEHKNLAPCGRGCLDVDQRRILQETAKNPYHVNMKLADDLESENYDPPDVDALSREYVIAINQLSFLLRAVLRDRTYPCYGHGLPTVANTGEVSSSVCICDIGWDGDDCMIPAISDLDPDAGTRTRSPTTPKPTTRAPTTFQPTTKSPTTQSPTLVPPTTPKPTTKSPTTSNPKTSYPTKKGTSTSTPTTLSPTTKEPTLTPSTKTPTTSNPTTNQPTTKEPTTKEPTTKEPTLSPPTNNPTTLQPSPNPTKYPTADINLSKPCIYGTSQTVCGAVTDPCLNGEMGDNAASICNSMNARLCTLDEIKNGVGFGAAPKSCNMKLMWTQTSCTTDILTLGFEVVSTTQQITGLRIKDPSKIELGDEFCYDKSDSDKIAGVLCCVEK